MDNIDERLADAAATGDGNLIRSLVNSGADPAWQDVEGKTALHKYLDRTSVDPGTVNVLLAASPWVVQLRDAAGDSAAHIACRGKHRKALELLAKNGAHLLAANAAGETVESLAVEGSIKRLLDEIASIKEGRAYWEGRIADPGLSLTEREHAFRILNASDWPGALHSIDSRALADAIRRQKRFHERGRKGKPVSLAGVCLEGLELRGLELEHAVLSSVACRNQNLTGARLAGSMLNSSRLSGSCLRNAQLQGVNLQWTALAACDLRGADLTDAILDDADLSKARLDWSSVPRRYRWRVVCEMGTATGELGEVNQPYNYVVIDHRSGERIANYEGSSHWTAFGQQETVYSGVRRVSISEDGSRMLITLEDESVTATPLP